MYSLNDCEFQVQAEPALQKVFADYASTGQWFSPTITARKVIYPCFSSFEEALPVDALVAAATALGDEGCYITLDWRALDEPNHCYIPLSELQESYAGEPGSEKLIGARLGMNVFGHYTTIFSANGKWGIKILEAGLAILGGVPEFMDILQTLVPSLDEQIHSFLHQLFEDTPQDNPEREPYFSAEWLYEILFQVYGQEVAATMVREAGLL
ncbi:MAG: hypothetical protein KME43_00125 [Myxacorys chilensis ATA2-1-KO14]|jgi:hypothetical protein|nr:hypothetical protein [Myxacorys chilensis ATA2-1-KO14]